MYDKNTFFIFIDISIRKKNLLKIASVIKKQYIYIY